jgi:hypothetical protein
MQTDNKSPNGITAFIPSLNTGWYANFQNFLFSMLPVTVSKKQTEEKLIAIFCTTMINANALMQLACKFSPRPQALSLQQVFLPIP